VAHGDCVGDGLPAVERNAAAVGERASKLYAADGEVDVSTGLGRPAAGCAGGVDVLGSLDDVDGLAALLEDDVLRDIPMLPGTVAARFHFEI
jgi:hypothetical protein